MGINYDKWNTLDAYSSSDDSETERENWKAAQRLRVTAEDDTKPKAVLVTVPWDSHCEAARWALDRHGVRYEERDYPWGLHILATLGYSDPMPRAQQLHVPIFKNDKDEQDLDTHLAPAARTIFLHTMLSKPTLSKKYLCEPVHLHTWRVANMFVWPVVRWWMKRGLGDVEEAWTVVHECFGKVEEELKKHGTNIINNPARSKSYLTGSTLTTADIVFGSHAALVLFPNEIDGEDAAWAGKLGISLPGLKELPADVETRVRELRRTVAGKFAMRLWRKDRGLRLKTRPSRYAKENNPWWVEEGRLRGVLWGSLALIGVISVTIMTTLPWWASLVVFVLLFGISAVLGYFKIRGTIVEERARQIWFVCFGKPVPPPEPLTGTPGGEGSMKSASEPETSVSDPKKRETEGKDAGEISAWKPSREAYVKGGKAK
ncbi:hypothetical protein HK104_000487 [Borealophlyctis nickersoniae]|nr:hypothetical protein HK104_000487 [Borealophlyctis nickersoniae]